LSTKTDGKTKGIPEHIEERSSIPKKYSLVKTNGIQPQVI